MQYNACLLLVIVKISIMVLIHMIKLRNGLVKHSDLSKEGLKI